MSAVVAVVGMVTLTACQGDGEVKTSPDKVAGSAAPKVEGSASAAPAKGAQKAAVGDTLNLKGQGNGEQLAVTIKKWADPATGKDEFNKPEDGKRWVAAQFELTNTGTAVYQDSPSNGAQVADEQGQRFEATIGEISQGPEMASGLKLPAGEKALGWIVFEVPKDSKIVTLQFAMNSGFADQTGQWAVK
ncbi:DUF4352 domain-containing protein [Streptomyces sp. NPDC046876]|uniref:DUF4352 domain-containing protein n=1 Tax=Streptomyces sp. NPDC046876 TaxID=3155616 RepID=UPI0033CA5329